MVTAVFFITGRFRFPMHLLLALMAGAGVSTLTKRARLPAALPAALVVGVATAVLLGPNWLAIGKAKTFGQYHYRLGVLAEREGHVDEAVSEYAAALKIDPTVARAAINLGVLTARQGDLRNAEMLLEKGVALDPRSARGFLALGQIHQIRGDPAGACTLFARAWKADSTFLKALESLATAAYAVGDTAATPPLAAQLIRRAGLDDPLSTRCRFILGRMQERQRFGWAVWSSIERAEGDLALSLRNLERASDLYNDALAKNPGDLAAILELARIAATRGDSAETARLVSRFLARGGPPAAVVALRQ